jgi:hypothetical protein
MRSLKNERPFVAIARIPSTRRGPPDYDAVLSEVGNDPTAIESWLQAHLRRRVGAGQAMPGGFGKTSPLPSRTRRSSWGPRSEIS